MNIFKYSILTFLVIQGIFQQLTAQIRVVCIGNSITYGSKLPDRLTQSYPAQLQKMLGPGYQVMNFGVSGATLLKNGNKPYWKTPAYQQALDSAPKIVFIKLGTNDSKLINRNFYPELETNYKEMIRSFADLKSKPRIILLTPIAAFTTDSSQIWDVAIKKSIIPALQQAAYEEGVEVIDLHSLFLDKENLLPDKIHPDAAGAEVIAERLKEQLVDVHMSDFDLSGKFKGDVKTGSFYGFKDNEFLFKGHKAHIVQPKFSAKGQPWIWRARFWGHEPQTDIALLERGYHLVYCDASELFGNQEALLLWNNFYKYLRKLGLGPKAVLEAMSRGAVYAYHWAAVNPEKVACVYADNPVLDMNSWPGGFGKGPGSKKEWEVFKKDYGYSTDAQAKASLESPVHKTGLIVKGGYPLLHVCADADELVPMDENTERFEKLILDAGGKITLIHKPGGKHHPHSLPNPEPIVRFILKASSFP